MDKFKEALEMILVMIFNIIDFTFLILEAPYIFIMSMFLSYEKCNLVYAWFPVCGVMSFCINDWTGKIECSIDGHILIKNLFKK